MDNTRDDALTPDRILVIEDDTSIRRVLRLQLEAAGYDVDEAEDGMAGLKVLETVVPDLILLDVMMPNMDGHTVCRKIREQHRLRHIPVIFLTAKAATESKIMGLDDGANDYLTKPYDRKELLLRINNLIGWGRQQRISNPLTGLPGNPAIEAEVKDRLANGASFSFMYIDLDNFKAYNDFYSYRAGDEIIKLCASTLTRAVEEKGKEGDFVGHVGGDDFVIVASDETGNGIADYIVKEFDARVPEYYQPKEREQGYVEIENRQKEMQRFSLVSVTIALIASDRYQIEHIAMLNDIVAELKHLGKQQKGSVVVRERRQDPSGFLRTGSDG